MSHTVDVLVKHQFNLGEGPHWDDRRQRLLFVDIEKSSVQIWDYDSNKLQEPIVLPDPSVSSVVTRESGGLVVTADHRYAAVDETTGQATTIAEIANNPETRFNDGKCDPNGRYWAGTMEISAAKKEGTVEHQGILYTLNTDLAVQEKMDNITLSNGLSWSSDGKTMYYIDTPTYKVVAFDFDVITGALTNKRTVTEFDKWLDGTPDGQCIDTDGNLWVAMYLGGRVIKVDTTTGCLTERVRISETGLRTTSVCFGGPNFDELFVTSAMNKLDRAAIDDESGSLFKVTGLGVKGLSSISFRG